MGTLYTVTSAVRFFECACDRVSEFEDENMGKLLLKSTSHISPRRYAEQQKVRRLSNRRGRFENGIADPRSSVEDGSGEIAVGKSLELVSDAPSE